MENDKQPIEQGSSLSVPADKPALSRGNGFAHIVTAESVQAEEIPTIPIDSLQTIDALQPEVAVHSVTSMQAAKVPTPLVVQPLEYRRGIREWLSIWRDGMRLQYLPLAFMPVLLGTTLAWFGTLGQPKLFGTFKLVPFIAALVVVILVQVGANLINDYHDYLNGLDTSNSLGPGGLIQQGLIKPTSVLYIGLGFLCVGALVGIVLAVMIGSPLFWLFGLIVTLCAYFYSASKFALSHIGLSEVISFFIFGPILTLGGYMLQTKGIVSPTAFLYSLPLGFLAAATIHANNMRDIESDEHSGKHTFATTIGLGWSRVVYVLLLFLAYLFVADLGLPKGTPHLVLIALWSLPAAVVAASGAIRTEIPIGFHLIMRETIRLLIYVTILLIVAHFIVSILPVFPIPHLPNILPTATPTPALKK